MCEAVALYSSVLVTQPEDTRQIQRLGGALEAVAARNPEIRSVAVRRDGQLAIEIGQHARHWRLGADDPSSDSQVQIPLWVGQRKWGSVELRFRPLSPPGLAGLVQNYWVRFVAFTASACLLLSMIYLGRMLKYLDPAKAVPRNVRSALDTLAEGLLVIDAKERIMLANQAMASAVGRRPEELMGLEASRLPWRGLNQQAGALALPWTAALLQRTPQLNVPLQLLGPDSTARTFSVNCAPVLNEAGECRGALVSLDDVTDLESQKVELRRAKEAADAANAAKSAFLASMSHEIRTPMNAVLGFTEVLRRGLADNAEQRQEYLGIIHRSGEHLLTLIDDILDFSKIEAGRLRVEMARCSPHRLIQEVVGTLRIRALQKGISLELVCQGPLPQTIETDSTRLRQVLINLVGNAIKFTERGGVQVVARFVPDGKQPSLVVDVIDTGIGMTPDVLERIFQPFVQADGSITRRFGGTGLGLSISRGFAEALGGTLSVESEAGHGSTFTVVVPVGDLAGVSLVHYEPEAPRSGRSGPQAADLLQLPRARVLVVDDGETNRQLASLILSRAGMQVACATNGREALEMVGQHDFDLVLIDMQMPVMDGCTATRIMRQRGVTVPIIALTGNALKSDAEECLAAGCSAFLTKPLNLDDLLRSVAQQVGSIAVLPSQPADNREPAELDDPGFREIAESFVASLGDRLRALESARAAGDFAEMAFLAHALKGTAPTVGFPALSAPAEALERAAKNREPKRLEGLLTELHELAAAITNAATAQT